MLGKRVNGYTADLSNQSVVRELFEQPGHVDHLIYSARDLLRTGVLAGICSAMEGLIRALVVELVPIRVNLVSPGLAGTSLWAAEAPYAASGVALPVEYVVEPEDLAQTYLYLMTNRYATRQTVVDSGGVLV
ncbi:hypothetical protein LMG24238_02263 [Paraburkholderia sediminicola]|uniref:Enoyl-ACP reductase-like protein n=1 Tax=Paraburkholderia sediminicola TaxID=458836 RepID=A0A6J5ATH5_9BURK|nr:SDR family oxidoreductase [Paraburkholderia sediminicola]CAB3674153.1 hypothetical protein LMG24238_02263 [Paraburkholderia sediminicola]